VEEGVAGTSTVIRDFGAFVLRSLGTRADFSAEWSERLDDVIEIRPSAAIGHERIDVFLGNAAIAIERDALSYDDAFEIFILKAILSYSDDPDYEVEELYAVVRHRDYLGDVALDSYEVGQRLGILPDGETSHCAYEIFAGQLATAIVARRDGGLDFSTAKSIERLGLSYAEALNGAIERTTTLIANYDIVQIENGLNVIRVYDDRDPSLFSSFALSKLLDLAFWRELRNSLGTDLAVVAPDRSSIIFAPISLIDLVRDAAEKWIQDADYIQATEPFVFGADGWRKFGGR